jgi:GNAT superfamily N-acetyltransferase
VSATAVRHAKLGDSAAIAAVHVRSWHAAYRGLLADEVIDAITVEDREQAWRGRLPARAPSFTLVGARDGAVAGFCAVVAPGRDEDAGARSCELAALYVDPDVWRAGVGAAMLGAALAEAAAAGWAEMTLWVLEGNGRARAFYERHGFAADGTVDAGERLGAAEIRMLRALGTRRPD